MLDRQSLSLQVVQCAGNENEILIHDEQNKAQAQLLAEMKGPNFPIAVGVLYKEEKSSFVTDVYEKIDVSKSENFGLGHKFLYSIVLIGLISKDELTKLIE